jgi:hypothetical protein
MSEQDSMLAELEQLRSDCAMWEKLAHERLGALMEMYRSFQNLKRAFVSSNAVINAAMEHLEDES